MGSVAAIVLAAGEASRFGSPKQRLLLPTVLARVARAAVDEIVVVSGAFDLESCDDQLQGRPPCRVVGCPGWRRGPGASLRCGLGALAAEVDVAVVVLADGPTIAPESIDRVLEVWHQSGGIVAASYVGDRGHPLVLGRDDWAGVPDEGLHARAVRLVACDDLGAPGDVDTTADLPPALGES